ncbi:tyrosine-type recombinase/integrase [Embleya sp. NPDC008237]|uniref:tyrosine-type recombinase/integrase n=1 Tax=Embleya sp. NPDC008237 TaxID=3363978 RepID=UPI0036E2CFAE
MNTTPARATATPETAPPQPRTRAWSTWLRDHLDPSWRPGEWDAGQWLFTGDLDNPRTSSSRCRTRSCAVVVRAQATFCSRCRQQRLDSGLTPEEFAATFAVPRLRSPKAAVTAQCSITRDGIRCVRPRHCRGLCATHYGTWRYHERRNTLESWLRDRATPFTHTSVCMAPHCTGRSLSARGLCNYHWRAWSANNRLNPTPAPQWARDQPPQLAPHQFSLLSLPTTLRLELAYAVQQMDQWTRALEPHWIRGVIRDLADATTLLDHTNADRLNKPHKAALRTLENLQSAAHAGYAEFNGITLIDRDVIDLRVLGLRHTASGKRRHQPGSVDLRTIRQPWLRRALHHWAVTARPNTQLFQRTLQATVIASTALGRRADAGEDPTVLTFADASTVVDAFRTARRRDDIRYSAGFRHALIGTFFQLVDYGRRCGTLDDLPGTFTRVPVEHAISVEEPNEDLIGKAVPESVIRQLDTHLDTLGTGNTYGCRDIAPQARQLMYRTLYIVLRDTGRRPLEIVSLPRDCLETDNGQTTLIWNNHKRGRHRRRLPITAAMAQTIRSWQTLRDDLHLPTKGDRYLFPALTPLSDPGHIASTYLSDAIRLWVDALPQLHDEGTDAQGNPLPFDRSRIYPYAFRHSYAQRHADAGTPVDVLRELMDHKTIAMTQHYYTVSLKRKREAVSKLSAHVVDHLGQPSPCSTTAYEMRSVAVPYGGCTEPSNVKAGGEACPIRFQCAGCGFYRPDPSYLPALEQHINELRADRETAHAMRTAEFVTTALTAQITAYEQVVDRMRTHLQALPDTERTRIEEASTILRKARAGDTHTLLPLTPTPRDTPR